MKKKTNKLPSEVATGGVILMKKTYHKVNVLPEYCFLLEQPLPFRGESSNRCSSEV